MSRSTRTAEPAKKVHEQVADELRQRIVTGELAVGERLAPEEELTRRFGIARTTLREALRVLESQGLLEIRRGRGGGPIVTRPDLGPAATALAISLQMQGTTIGDLDEARTTMESHAVGRLARRHGSDDIRALDEAIARAADAADAADPDAFGEAAALVHETVLERSGNTTLVTISRLLHELVRDYYVSSAAVADRRAMRRAVRSYRRLVEHIEAGDVEKATDHWRAQMAYTVGHHPDTPLTPFT